MIYYRDILYIRTKFKFFKFNVIHLLKLHILYICQNYCETNDLNICLFYAHSHFHAHTHCCE